MKIIKGGVTAPLGFKASGIDCGIKGRGKKDLALIYSSEPANAAAVFTANKIPAAPVIITREHIRNNQAQAIVINSGNANCATGKKGVQNSILTAHFAGNVLGIEKSNVLVASTGKIGVPLPIKLIKAGMPRLVKKLSRRGGHSAARAIMTTDKRPKQIAVTIMIGKHRVTIGGMAKGSGMISPNLATMLAVITTDASIAPLVLNRALKSACDKSFNCITVDGDMSTNDTVLVLANGLARNRKIIYGTKGAHVFSRALDYVTLELAKMIVADGEGAGKFVEVIVKGARRASDARRIALNVANSNLVKTALAGSDPNWGRIVAALGASGVNINPGQLDIYLGERNKKGMLVLKDGNPRNVDKGKLGKVFKNKELGIVIDLNMAGAEARIYTCDLSREYVRINAKYTT